MNTKYAESDSAARPQTSNLAKKQVAAAFFGAFLGGLAVLLAFDAISG